MLSLRINEDRCIRCGKCIKDCPTRVLVSDGGVPTVAPGKSGECLKCQHCLAVCPTAALSILGHDPAFCTPLKKSELPTAESLKTLIAGRRSYRAYKDENLDAALVDDLLETAWHAPTGKNNQQLLFTAVRDRKIMQQVREKTYAAIAQRAEAGTLPESLKFFASLERIWKTTGNDILFRSAPHMLVTSSPADSPCPEADGIIALSYFELYAQVNGVGTLWDFFAKWALGAVAPEMARLMGIPENHVVTGVLLFGPPSVKYHRTVDRGPAKVHNVVKL